MDTIGDDKQIIAVDASLGKETSVGAVVIDSKGMSPGTATDKGIPHIEGIGISGIVNVIGEWNLEVIRSTRLSVVEKIADVIVAGIKYYLKEELK